LSQENKIFIASDHAAFWQKKYLIDQLNDEFDIDDLGTHSEDSVNYPDYASKLAESVVSNPGSRGLLLCGSGVGVSMVANRYSGIRAALCRDEEDAKLSREHNNSNVICLGGRKSSEDELLNIVNIWLSTEFEGGRHQARVELFDSKGE
jgi:ribose 5-phosphate isomerase B